MAAEEGHQVGIGYMGRDGLFYPNESALWANCPLNANDPALLFEFFDDFMHPATSAVSDVSAWTKFSDGSTGTATYTEAAGGIFSVATAATQDDYHGYNHAYEMWTPAAGKRLWFEARFKLTEATTNDAAYWFGITDTLTTGGFQTGASGPLADYDGILIWKDEDSMTLDFETSNATTQNTTSAMATVVTNTWTRVGFYFDGTATTSVVTPYYEVTGVAGAAMLPGTPQNLTLASMTGGKLVFGVKAGPGGAAETLLMDYIKCVAMR